jgi:hypothetical protein
MTIKSRAYVSIGETTVPAEQEEPQKVNIQQAWRDACKGVATFIGVVTDTFVEAFSPIFDSIRQLILGWNTVTRRNPRYHQSKQTRAYLRARARARKQKRFKPHCQKMRHHRRMK